jgi:hypothetical protein
LETDSLTVELTPLKPLLIVDFVIVDWQSSINNQQFISLLYAAYACGSGCRTF